MKNFSQSFACLIFLAVTTGHTSVIVSGSATWVLEEGKANRIPEFDAYFNEARTRVETLSLPAPGNSAFADPGNVVIDADEDSLTITGDLLIGDSCFCWAHPPRFPV